MLLMLFCCKDLVCVPFTWLECVRKSGLLSEESEGGSLPLYLGYQAVTSHLCNIIKRNMWMCCNFETNRHGFVLTINHYSVGARPSEKSRDHQPGTERQPKG